MYMGDESRDSEPAEGVRFHTSLACIRLGPDVTLAEDGVLELR